MIDVAYGTAIRRRKSGLILDVDLALDRAEAESLVTQQNAKCSIQESGVKWVVVEVRPVGSADL